MTEEAQTIEVEVVTVDGVAPVAELPHTREATAAEPPWRTWQGRIRTFDARWWPLWVILGIIAIVLLLTVGLVFGVIFMVFRIIRGVVRLILG